MRDTALAEVWAGSVAEGLFQVMGQHQAWAWQAIEEAWLIASLVDEGLSQEHIARGLGKDKSCLSRCNRPCVPVSSPVGRPTARCFSASPSSTPCSIVYDTTASPSRSTVPLCEHQPSLPLPNPVSSRG